jgi:hypothetical protein
MVLAGPLAASSQWTLTKENGLLFFSESISELAVCNPRCFQPCLRVDKPRYGSAVCRSRVAISRSLASPVLTRRREQEVHIAGDRAELRRGLL